MRNIIKLYTSRSCNMCDKEGFFCHEYNDGDNVYCPICGGLDDEYTLQLDYNECLEKYGYDYDDKPYNITGNREIERIIGHYEYNYCDHCNIIYNRGSCHYSQTHVRLYNGELVGKWEYQGNTYIGMPCFNDIEEYLETIKDIKILDMVEPNREAGMEKCNV